jgi:hypothetical protein
VQDLVEPLGGGGDVLAESSKGGAHDVEDIEAASP